VGLRLVNLFPGSPSDYSKPGQPIQFGLKSDGVLGPPQGSIVLGSLRVSLGHTSIQNEGLLPEGSATLQRLGVSVGLDTAELIRPVGLQAPRSPFGVGIKIDAAASASPAGIYSVKVPVEKEAAVLGYFKFKSDTSWGLASRNWCNLSNMTGMYFGLEYGQANTICWASLRGGGSGSLVIGGPLQTFGAARPAQREISAFNWLAQPSGTVLEMWIVFSMAGYPAPFSPTRTPIVEVWTKRDGVDLVPVCHTLASPLPVTLLGSFPTTLASFPNFRPAPAEHATLFFGNVGSGSDSLELLDWALFPDYRVAVIEGEAIGQNRLTVRTDSPLTYNCLDGRPQDVSPGRWFPIPDSGFVPPSANLYFSPHRTKPSFVVLSKSSSGGSGFQRVEPRLQHLDDGAFIEAFMSTEIVDKPLETSGTGLTIDDGVRLFQVVMLESSTRRTVGLSKTGGVGSLSTDYFTPDPSKDVSLDWRSPKLVRLVVDRIRGRVSVFVDGVRYLDEAIVDMPASVSGGRFAFGHVEMSATKAKHNIAFLSYLSRFAAWEIDEQLLPSASPAVFTLEMNGTTIQSLYPPTPDASELRIEKVDFNSLNSRCFYKRLLPTFDERFGMQMDFRAKVLSYTNSDGTPFAKNMWVGSGAQVFLGNKKLHLGFFDCGASGRFIGVIPGSGNVEDIIKQTALGKSFSYPVDWSIASTYRLSYRPFDKIEIWVDNIPSGPVLTIPWLNDTDGFDLPQDTSVAAVAFGHFDQYASSSTAWEFFRYGVGNGFEVSVEPLFQSPMPGYLFGGRTLIQTEFDE
jgi:hypothetical protein